MDFLRNLFERKPSTKTKTIQHPPDPSNEEEYVRRCLENEFLEEQETRTFSSDPALASVLTPLNSQQYTQAIKAAQTLLPLFSDLDLIYKWLASAYRHTQELSKSRDILCEGLAKAKRKSLLLTDMGETEWQSGNIIEAVYWWSQALHCLSSNPVDYNAYLLLSYVAKGLDLVDFEQMLLARVDILHSGQVRVDPTTEKRLITLVQSKQTRPMRKALYHLQSKYFSTPALVSERKEDLKEDLESLISQLKNADADARGSAAESLGRLADPKAIRPLYQLMREESQRMFKAGMSALESFPPDFTLSHQLGKAAVHTKAANACRLPSKA